MLYRELSLHAVISGYIRQREQLFNFRFEIRLATMSLMDNFLGPDLLHKWDCYPNAKLWYLAGTSLLQPSLLQHIAAPDSPKLL